MNGHQTTTCHNRTVTCPEQWTVKRPFHSETRRKGDAKNAREAP